MSLMSTCRRLRVGCVVITPKMTEVLAVGYNGPPAGIDNLSCDQSAVGACGCVHAEANAVIKMGRVDEPATMIVTTSPCRHCAGVIINSRKIGRVIYDSEYRLGDGAVALRAAGVECVSTAEAIPRVIVIGERENGDPRLGDEGTPPAEAWRVSLCRGAFVGRESKLASIGVNLSRARSANLLEASRVPGIWSHVDARAVAESGLEDQPGTLWVICGRRAWAAFGGPDSSDWGDATPIGRDSRSQAILVPHPSGLNRWWNDKKNPPRMRRTLDERLSKLS